MERQRKRERNRMKESEKTQAERAKQEDDQRRGGKAGDGRKVQAASCSCGREPASLAARLAWHRAPARAVAVSLGIWLPC